MTQIGRMFEQEKEDAVREARLKDLFSYVSDGAMTVDYAAKRANLSVEVLIHIHHKIYIILAYK